MLNPKYAGAYNNLGVALTEMGNYRPAILSYERAMLLQADYPDPYYNLSNLSTQINLPDQKTKKFQKQLTLLLEKKIGIKLICDSLIKSYLNNEISAAKQLQKRLENSVSSDSFKMLNSGDRRFCTAYHKMIKSLLLLERNDGEKKSLPSVFHIGESHCLSFAHRFLKIRGESHQIKPRIIYGAKAWHFAKPKENKFKGILRHHASRIPTGSLVFLSFGEIDCRQDEGILAAATKSKKTIEQLVYNTVCGYLEFISQQFLDSKCDVFVLSVPAPVIVSYGKATLSREISERISLVKEFNKQLRRQAIQLGYRFIDTHSFTTNKHGVSNNEFHLDGTHLAPKALKKIEDIIRLSYS